MEEPPASEVQEDPSTSEAAEDNYDEDDGEIDIQVRLGVCWQRRRFDSILICVEWHDINYSIFFIITDTKRGL